ncbi:MAG: hypothetical protein MI974_11975 [Chitinophagales bacterium]|nr:hypothetical protein [Chitinophagales bacterium]
MFGNNYSSPKGFHPGKIFFFIGMAILFVLVLGGVVMLLWNAILPDLVGVKPIQFWQAIGLLILSRILFGGFKFGPKGKKHYARRRQWKEKWMNMNEEERAAFKERWRKKC